MTRCNTFVIEHFSDFSWTMDPVAGKRAFLGFLISEGRGVVLPLTLVLFVSICFYDVSLGQASVGLV